MPDLERSLARRAGATPQPSAAPGGVTGSLGATRPASPGAAGDEAMTLQQAAGNQTVQAWARRSGAARPSRGQRAPGGAGASPTPAQAPEPSGPAVPAEEVAPISFTLGPFEVTIETYTQLAALGRLGIMQLRTDLEGVEASSPVHAQANEWIEEVTTWLPYLESQGGKRLSAWANAQASRYLEDWWAITGEIGEAKRVQARQALWRAEAEAEAAAAQAETLRPKLDDVLRAAYRTGEESRIREAADVIGTALDIGMGLHELAREIAEVAAEARGIELAPVGRLTEGLSKFNKGLAAFNLFLIVTDREQKATAVEQGMHQINGAAGAFAALATLGGLPAHVGLYANLYLVPMTKAIMAQVSRLVESLHEVNREAVEALGDLMYPGAEPGGQEMFDFMVAVMHAEAAHQLPRMPASVQEYLLDHREQLEAGAREGHKEAEELPTSGWWFWRDLDTPGALEWVFEHRRSVWAMFYGSMKVPERRAVPGARE